MQAAKDNGIIIKSIMFENNEKLQEFFFLLGNGLGEINKRWWYAILASIVLVVPLFFILRIGFFEAFVGNYQGPEITYQPVHVEPLEIVDRGVFKLNGEIYSGFVKIRNANLERGVPEQKYSAEFKTAGGSVVTRVEGQTFILPAREKIIVFSRFTAEKEPAEINFTLHETRFVHQPDLPTLITEVQRVEIQNLESEFVVSAVVKNFSPFIINQVYLPVVLYNNSNQVVGVNLTNINDLRSLEPRSFRVVWPNTIQGVVRAEIRPEINIFDRLVISNEPGSNQFDVPEVDRFGL